MISTPAKLSLADRLRERIHRDGPITFHDWMGAALYDLEDGYYCQREKTRWGREGDYRTSTERTGLFAATFAAYFAGLYEKLGEPSAWTILEAGAGNGKFALGVLQTLENSYPHVFAATHYLIDEVSEDSAATAEENLLQFSNKVQFVRLSELAKFEGIVFSNELFDAFPVHRIQLRDGAAGEFFVTVDSHGNFEWTLQQLSAEIAVRIDSILTDMCVDVTQNQTIEVSLEANRWIEAVSSKIDRGFVVTVDYGGTPQATKYGTLRGFKAHQFVDELLATPGENDLTTNVNWNFVTAIGSRCGLTETEFARLDQFLLAHGFLDQLEIACKDAGIESDRMRLRNEAHEMILPDGMASYFQVLVQEKAPSSLEGNNIVE